MRGRAIATSSRTSTTRRAHRALAGILALGAGLLGLAPGGARAAAFGFPRALCRADTCAAVRVSFVRTAAGRAEEVERGTFTTRVDGAWRADYEAPLRQLTVSTAGLTTILYPADRRAVRLWTRQLEAPAWASFAFQALYSAEELTAAGFRMRNFEARGDTSVTSWVPPGAGAAADRSDYRVFHHSGLIVRIDVVQFGQLARQLRVEETATLRGVRVPLRTRLSEWDTNGRTDWTIEYTGYELIRAAGAMFDQTVPADYRVDERRW